MLACPRLVATMSSLVRMHEFGRADERAVGRRIRASGRRRKGDRAFPSRRPEHSAVTPAETTAQRPASTLMTVVTAVGIMLVAANLRPARRHRGTVDRQHQRRPGLQRCDGRSADDAAGSVLRGHGTGGSTPRRAIRHRANHFRIFDLAGRGHPAAVRPEHGRVVRRIGARRCRHRHRQRSAPGVDQTRLRGTARV